MDNIGGAEMVTLTLAQELKADIYTTVVDREKIKKMGFENINIKTIGWIPVNAPFRQQAAQLRFRFLNLKNQYDFYIIAGDWALAGAVNNKPNLWYAYSPPRELWDLYDHMRANVVPWHGRLVFDLWVKYNRRLMRKNIKHANQVVAISNNVKVRIEKFLNHSPKVIYPPVDIEKYYYNKNGDFWLSVNRLFFHKRVEMQMKAFAKMPDQKLVVVGSFERAKHFTDYAKYIYSIKPPNVEILSWVDDKQLLDLYANCKGFITTAIDEDFGLTPVEAMASGKPVVAAAEGGYLETVINGETGILVKDINEEKLVEVIKVVSQDPQKYKEACQKRAKEFDVSVYMKKMRQVVEENYNATNKHLK